MGWQYGLEIYQYLGDPCNSNLHTCSIMGWRGCLTLVVTLEGLSEAIHRPSCWPGGTGAGHFLPRCFAQNFDMLVLQCIYDAYESAFDYEL